MAQVVHWFSALPLWAYYLLFGLLALLLARKSQVDEWVEAHPRIGGLMKTLRGVGLDPWIILQGLCLIVFGRLPKKPVLGIKPKMPPPLALVMLMWALALHMLCLVVIFTPACAAAPPPPTKTQVIEASEALAFNGAAVALVMLDEQEGKRLDAIEHPTTEQIEVAKTRNALLHTARDALQRARDWIMGQTEVSGPELISEALAALRQVVASIKAEGGQVPPEIEKALAIGGEYL